MAPLGFGIILMVVMLFSSNSQAEPSSMYEDGDPSSMLDEAARPGRLVQLVSRASSPTTSGSTVSRGKPARVSR